MKSRKMVLTAKRIETLSEVAKHRDLKCPGLSFDISKFGGRFSFNYSLNGKPHSYGLGPVTQWENIDQARGSGPGASDL